MELKGNTILITGGATGIGFSFAERLSELGNTVIICGRRNEKLEEAKKRVPSLHTVRSDVSDEGDRKILLEQIENNFPGFNVLINNAGIQRRIDLTAGDKGIKDADEEIEINFKSHLHVTSMFLPLLLKRQNSAVINVTSGLGFIPLSFFPVYSATKAAMHSYTLSLRHQLRNTGVKVFEVIPPTVHDTELKGKPMEKSDYSISTSEMTDALIDGLSKDIPEISAGASQRWLKASNAEVQQIFSGMNH